MKKYILSLVVVISILTACKEDDINENPNPSPVTVEGTWKLTAWKSANAYDFNGDGIANTNLLKEFDCYYNRLFIFNANGTGIAKNDSYADVIANLVTGTNNTYTYTINCVVEQSNSLFTWARNENTVALIEGGNTDNFTLEGNTIFFIVEGFVVAVDQDHHPIITEDLIFVYTKQ